MFSSIIWDPYNGYQSKYIDVIALKTKTRHEIQIYQDHIALGNEKRKSNRIIQLLTANQHNYNSFSLAQSNI